MPLVGGGIVDPRGLEFLLMCRGAAMYDGIYQYKNTSVFRGEGDSEGRRAFS
jgi:hypothetical protein